MMRRAITVALIVGYATMSCMGNGMDASWRPWEKVLGDDMATRSSLKKGTFECCLKDAHAGGFHQGSTVGGKAVYTFDPELDGCYVIEEWHPGNEENCARHMSESVRLDVDYCKGKRAYTFVDQSLNGGHWNVLGALPFYKGWTGKITVTNEGEFTNCRNHRMFGTKCLFVADAFRIRRVPTVGGRCRVPEEIYAQSEKTTTVELTTTPATTTEWKTQQVIGNFVQTIVDDVDAISHAAWNWHEMGSKSPHLSCGVQGWKQRFLFLDPQLTDETEAPATFIFDPPEDGCYLVEEFHPANVCDKELSPLVQVSIEYCKNKTSHATLDQTKFGNRWNSIAILPFYRGHKGKVIVNHPQVNKGIAAADAFRFTRVSTTCAAAPLKLVEYSRLSQHPVSVTIDDRHALIKGASASSVCGSTGLDASVHAAADGHAFAIFTFVPPSTGCFRLDEFHPKTDSSCALAAEAGVRVDYCIGQSWQGTFPLSSFGGQWNVVGHFPFYAGLQGNITSRRVGKDTWVADGFRLTKVSDTCSQRPFSGLVTLRVVGVDLESSGLPDGQLTTHADLRIAFHEAVVASIGLPNQNVRLIGLRRGSIIAEFELIGSKNNILQAIRRVEADLANPAGSELGKKMCAAASSGRDSPVVCHAELVRTEVLEGTDIRMNAHESFINESEEGTLKIVLIAAACGVVVMAALIFAIVRMRQSRRRMQSQQGTTKHVDAVEVKEHDKNMKDSASECCSTGTPPSEKVSSEVQTDVSGDISEIGSQASREGTLDATDSEHHVNVTIKEL